ncbi:solute carrier family 15 member 4-like [Lineus longissimus]|uniref:solute carrier family 15 member 4-like n=1 Tax=Lineus longissimus TaxID=88925 RepID=UPI00315C8AF0
MDSNPDTLLDVLINRRDGTRFSKVGFACVCLFELANGMGIYALNNAVSLSGEYFGLSNYQMRILFVFHFANSYISPLLAALFTDLKVGKYRTIFFTAAMRTFAATILLIIAVTFSVSDKATMHPTLKSALFGIYVFALMFLFLSIEFFSSLLIPFGIQQVNQESGAAIASAVRWLLWSYDVGVVVSTLALGYLRSRYWESHILAETVASFIFSCLMISVFILGKSQYNRCTPTEGRASFATILNIFKTRLCCCRSRYESLNEPMTFSPDNSEQHVNHHQRIKMENLILRKLFLMIGFFACIGVGEVIYFKMIFIKASGWPRDFGRHGFPLGYPTLVVYIPTIVCIPIYECFSRRKRVTSPLTGVRKVIHFRTMGAGLFMAALAILAAALLCHFKQMDPITKSQSLWQVPIYIVLGMLTPLTYIKALEFCYTESFKGLVCVTTSLLTSLWMLLYSIITWTGVEWNQDSHHLEIIFYSLCGAMVVTIFFIFIPVSILYNRVKSEIDEATTILYSRGYNTLTGSTLLTGRFTANEEKGERVPIDGSDHESEETMSVGRMSWDSELGSDNDF